LTSELIASYLEAIGTISAVILALFLQVYLVWKRRPRLSLEYSAGVGSNDYRNVEKVDFCEHWLQFRVVAKSGLSLLGTPKSSWRASGGQTGRAWKRFLLGP
jgi:hypothetical protein